MFNFPLYFTITSAILSSLMPMTSLSFGMYAKKRPRVIRQYMYLGSSSKEVGSDQPILRRRATKKRLGKTSDTAFINDKRQHFIISTVVTNYKHLTI